MLEDSSFLRRNGKNKDFTTTIVFTKMNLNNICTVFTSVFWNCALFYTPLIVHRIVFALKNNI